ncbi:hypothetical protein [Thioclava electrotropha]|uniref:Uncharacterized protein n=1 Tax=Thioclava electrotropha TaxID=1549850 RepID=A0ABX6YTD2_9RHOB|nr:hypothetical protein [Thioclava electrotropha]QPZ90983.1 hypothetical protein AKL02_008735 [Thioclava electrotropha]
MAVEKMPTGKKPQTNDIATNKGHAALAWPHFFRTLSEEKAANAESTAPRSAQK